MNKKKELTLIVDGGCNSSERDIKPVEEGGEEDDDCSSEGSSVYALTF